jgi:hypothetical protein
VASGEDIFFSLKGTTPKKKKYYDMSFSVGNKCRSKSILKNLVPGLRTGHLGTENKERSGKHPPYQYNLAHSSSCLFRNLKNHLKLRKFSSTDEATVTDDG